MTFNHIIGKGCIFISAAPREGRVSRNEGYGNDNPGA